MSVTDTSDGKLSGEEVEVKLVGSLTYIPVSIISAYMSLGLDEVLARCLSFKERVSPSDWDIKKHVIVLDHESVYADPFRAELIPFYNHQYRKWMKETQKGRVD